MIFLKMKAVVDSHFLFCTRRPFISDRHICAYRYFQSRTQMLFYGQRDMVSTVVLCFLSVHSEAGPAVGESSQYGER